MQQPLTERQQKIYDFICDSIRRRGYPPTLREIGAEMEIKSTNGVSDHLRALERKGYLRREDMKSRALRPIEPGKADPDENATAPVPGSSVFANNDAQGANDDAQVLSVPVLGRVAAGAFALTADECDYRVSVDREMLRGAGPRDEVFALKVKGDSMIEAGILNGDLLFVKRAQTANRNDIVVALLGDEATVKRYIPGPDHVRLQPENSALQPIIVKRSEAAAKNFSLLGVVVGLFRNAML